MHISELETPAILIDLDIMERNLARAADYARTHRLTLLPHTKTHKIPALARRQLALGAAGITVAKVGEAEVMLEAEPPELYVAYPVIGRGKLSRLMSVASKTRVRVGLDSEAAARGLSEAAVAAGVVVGVLVEVDLGLRRVGVAPGRDLIELAKRIDRMPGLQLQGITFYPGHIKSADDEGLRNLKVLSDILDGVVTEWQVVGLPPAVVSGGSTPLLYQSHCIRALTEIRPGTYIFNDKNTWHGGGCTLADCAASVLTTVVSTAVPNQVIIDGGSKTFSSDRLAGSSEVHFGYVTDAPEATFTKLMEEHGFVEFPAGSAQRFAVGDRLRIIPNHICVAMNLHEQVYGVRGDEVVETWRVAARGKLQ